MVRCLRRAVPLGALVAMLASAPVPVSAQLGGLVKKAAKKAVEEKVEDAIPFTPMDPPEFTDRVLEITPDRLDGLLRGFEAEASFAKSASKEYEESVRSFERAHEAWEKASAEWEKEQAKWDVCAESFREKEAEASAANEARVQKALEDMDEEELERYVEELATRGEKLARDLQAGKSDPDTQKAWEQYQREVQALVAEQQRRALLVMSGSMAESRRERTVDARLEAACGKKPEQPVEPTSDLAGPEGVLAARGSEAAGLTAEQYAVMRERVLYWWEQDRRPARMGFTQEEIDLLDERFEAVDEAFERMKKAKVPL